MNKWIQFNHLIKSTQNGRKSKKHQISYTLKYNTFTELLSSTLNLKILSQLSQGKTWLFLCSFHFFSSSYFQVLFILTLPLLTASLASSTQWLTFADIHRYLKNLWWADQNWPHMLFFIRCSASINSAALLNLSLAVTH